MSGREEEKVKEERVEGITERGVKGNSENTERDENKLIGSRWFESWMIIG